ncbi:MAG TPA: hypothetical protein VFH63_01945 [candidate division Zixibacteria bacterium]|nr:hypothetical protein [candidate division Zixibacteria bacterium]
MTPEARANIAAELRYRALVMVNDAADGAGPMSELDRAVFILRRLYPEFTESQVVEIRAELARREAAGRWSGFERPSRLREGQRGSQRRKHLFKP